MTNRTATFTVTLNQDHANVVSVNYATFAKDAVSGSDFAQKTGTLTFNAGEKSKTIDVTVYAVSDRDLQFGVMLSNISNGTLSTAYSGLATIKSDNALSALVALYNTKKSAYNDAMSQLATANANAAWASANYNNCNNAYNNAVQNQNNAYNNYVNAKNASDGAYTYYQQLYAAAANGTVPWAYVIQASNDYNAKLGITNNALSAYNTTVAQKNDAQNALNAAANTLNNYNAAVTAANNVATAALAAMTAAQTAASAGFVGSTTLHP